MCSRPLCILVIDFFFQTLFSLLVHHGPTTSIIHDVDPNWYSYMDMCQDVLEIVLVDLPANIGVDINIKCEIPNSMDIMNLYIYIYIYIIIDKTERNSN